MFSDLNEENFLIYAIKSYDKPNCILSEFEEDIQRIKYIKRLLKRYKQTGILKERLILNHIIILSNVFGVEPTIRMLFFKLDPESYGELKAFLMYLKLIPEEVKGINGMDIELKDIEMNIFIVQRLKQI